MGVSNVGWVDLSGVEQLSMDLKTIRGRLSRNMRKATATSAKQVSTDARALIASQVTGKTTGGYPESITWEVKKATAEGVLAEVGPLVNPQNPKQAIQLEYGNSHQAPKMHLRPALMKEFDNFGNEMADAAKRAILP